MRYNLKRAREAQGLTQAVLSSKLKIPLKAYRGAEAGKNDLNAKVWKQLVTLLKTPDDVLKEVAGTNKKTVSEPKKKKEVKKEPPVLAESDIKEVGAVNNSDNNKESRVRIIRYWDTKESQKEFEDVRCLRLMQLGKLAEKYLYAKFIGVKDVAKLLQVCQAMLLKEGYIQIEGGL